MKNKLTVSFSGGRSSAAMCWLIQNTDTFAAHEKQFIFANTGQEHPATLDFVDECDRRFGLNLVWVEADIDPIPNKGTNYKEVTYQTATRHYLLFEKGCQKYGLPNPTWKWCTRELKLAPITKYRKITGFGKALTAIGIRADEIDRLSDNPMFIYPLADLGWTKQTVNSFWMEQDFDLQIPSDAYGNCVWCYKKSFRKLATIARTNPEYFEVPKYLEENYAFHGARPEKTSTKKALIKDLRKMNEAETIEALPHNLEKLSRDEIVMLYCKITKPNLSHDQMIRAIETMKEGNSPDIPPEFDPFTAPIELLENTYYLAAQPRQIFRNHQLTDYILRLANDPHLKEYHDPGSQMSLLDLIQFTELDIGGDCDQGCEISFDDM